MWCARRHCADVVLLQMQRLSQLIADLRAVAARTPPHEAKSKKKTPAEVAAAFDAIVRPFYVECEAAPNQNKAKKAVWSLLFPIMAPWTAETTVKSKMQNANSKVLASVANASNEFKQLAAATSAFRRPC